MTRKIEASYNSDNSIESPTFSISNSLDWKYMQEFLKSSEGKEAKKMFDFQIEELNEDLGKWFEANREATKNQIWYLLQKPIPMTKLSSVSVREERFRWDEYSHLGFSPSEWEQVIWEAIEECRYSWCWEDLLPPEIMADNINLVDLITDSETSEDTLITIAWIFANYLFKHWWEQDEWNDPSREQMWNEILWGDGSWVCRHIHTEVAVFLAKAGMKAGVITTSMGWRHVLTIAQKKDGNWVLIDYGDIYQGSSLEDVKNYYLAKYGSINFAERIAYENGEIVRKYATELERVFADQSAFGGKSGALDRSDVIMDKWISVMQGWNYHVFDDTIIKNIWLTKSYKIVWIEGKYVDKNKFWGVRAMQHTFDYTQWSWKAEEGETLKYREEADKYFDDLCNSWWIICPEDSSKESEGFSGKPEVHKGLSTYTTFSVWWGRLDNYQIGDTKFQIVTSWMTAISRKEGGYYIIDDGMANVGINARIEQSLGDKLTLIWWAEAGGDIYIGNIRDAVSIGFYPQYGVYAWMSYKDIVNQMMAKVIVNRRQEVWYQKMGMKANAQIKQDNLSLKATQEIDTSWWWLPVQREFEVNWAREITDASKLFLKISYLQKWDFDATKAVLGGEYKF